MSAVSRPTPVPVEEPRRARRPGAPGRGRVRVLHVIQNLNYGGMERVLADITRHMDEGRFEGHVLALQYLGRFSAGLEGVAQLHLGPRMSRWSMLRPASLASQIARIGPRVVHSHSGVWYKASLAARMAGVPRIVHTEHGRPAPDPFRDRLLDSIAARRTDVVVAVSERLGQDLIAKRIAPASRIRVLHNGVDTDLYRPAVNWVLRRAVGIDAAVPVIGSIGRLEGIKGYEVMVSAFVRLVEAWDGPGCPVLVIAGEGSERPRLESMIAASGAASRIHLLGWRDDVHELHAAFTLFTLSSHSEGTSISLLEAMSAGLCPVVTDVGGNRAVLGPALGHRLVPAANPEALAGAWRVALMDSAQRSVDAAAARTRVESTFSLGSMVRGYEDLYDPIG